MHNLALKESKWSTRAWTLQEAELSHSQIVLGQDLVYSRCPENFWCEDIVSKAPSIASKDFQRAGGTSHHWYDPQALERSTTLISHSKWPGIFVMYARIVESYTARDMTHPMDTL